MSLQLGGVELTKRFRVDPRELAVLTVFIVRVVAALAELVVLERLLAVLPPPTLAAFRAFWISRTDAFMAASIVFRFSWM